MAPPNDEDHHPATSLNNHEQRSRDDANPFVVFRRFVDDEVASLFSAFGTVRPHVEKAFEDLEKEHQVAWHRFTNNYERTTNPERTRIQPRTGESQTMDQNQKQQEVKYEEAQESWTQTRTGELQTMDRRKEQQEDRYREAQVSQTPPTSPSRLPPFPLSVQIRLPAHDDEAEYDVSLPFPISTATDWAQLGSYHHDVPSWELDYVSGSHRPTAHFHICSPYSPRQLERHSLTKWYGDKWQRAFQDLQLVQEGVTDGTAKDAYLHGQPLFYWFDNDTTPDSANYAACHLDSDANTVAEVKESTETELDQYEKFLGGGVDMNKQGQHFIAQKSHQSSLISSLTTTERRRAPDGTITTRRVLKKRFADGTEETEESTDVSHVAAVAPSEYGKQSISAPQTHPVQDAVAEEQRKTKGTWFWS